MPSDRRRGRLRRYDEDSYYDDTDHDSYPSDDDSSEYYRGRDQSRKPRSRTRSALRSIADRVKRSLSLNPDSSRRQSGSAAGPQRYPRDRRRGATYYDDDSDYYSDYHSPRPRPRGRRPESLDRLRWHRAVVAGLDTAVLEAWRVRKEPGSWTGSKGARVATAALGAAALDAMIDKNPNGHHKRKTMESTLGGLLLNRVLNGPRDDLKKKKGKWR